MFYRNCNWYSFYLHFTQRTQVYWFWNLFRHCKLSDLLMVWHGYDKRCVLNIHQFRDDQKPFWTSRSDFRWQELSCSDTWTDWSLSQNFWFQWGYVFDITRRVSCAQKSLFYWNQEMDNRNVVSVWRGINPESLLRTINRLIPSLNRQSNWRLEWVFPPTQSRCVPR